MLGTTERPELALALFQILLAFMFALVQTVLLLATLLTPMLWTALFAPTPTLALFFFLLPPVLELQLPVLLSDP